MADSDFSAISQVVPQASYEIVGRITPGIVVILSLLVTALGPTRAVIYLDNEVIHTDELSGWAVALVIIAAYVLAFVLDGIWQIPACIRRRHEGLWLPDLRAPSTSLKFDVVNQKLPTAGAWLTKLYAETNTTQVLIIGWLISAAINTFCLAIADSEPLSERVWLEVGLIVCIVGVVAVRNSIATTRDRTLENLWFLLQERILLERTNSSS